MANDFENRILEPRGEWTEWNCVSLQRTSTGWVNILTQSSPRRLKKFGYHHHHVRLIEVEDIPTSPEVIEAHMMNFKPIFTQMTRCRRAISLQQPNFF